MLISLRLGTPLGVRAEIKKNLNCLSFLGQALIMKS